MGLRFRKSIKLGCGVRINLSKSGIGYSIGGRGFRTTVNPKGRITNTVSAPGTGLSYRTSFSGSSSSHSSSSSKTAKSNTDYAESAPLPNTVSADIGNFQTAEYADLIAKINRIIFLRNFTVILAVIAILCPSLLLSSSTGGSLKPLAIIMTIILVIFVNACAVVDLDYDMDEETAGNYEGYYSMWKRISGSSVKQQIYSADFSNKKISPGEYFRIQTKDVTFSNNLPSYLKTNVRVNVLKLYNETLCFLPDKILIIKSGKVGAINYDDVVMQYSNQKIVSAELLRTHDKIEEFYEYENKSGGPDMRYKNNPRLNVYLCGKISMKSESGLNVILVLPDHKIVDDLSHQNSKPEQNNSKAKGKHSALETIASGSISEKKWSCPYCGFENPEWKMVCKKCEKVKPH